MMNNLSANGFYLIIYKHRLAKHILSGDTVHM